MLLFFIYKNTTNVYIGIFLTIYYPVGVSHTYLNWHMILWISLVFEWFLLEPLSYKHKLGIRHITNWRTMAWACEKSRVKSGLCTSWCVYIPSPCFQLISMYSFSKTIFSVISFSLSNIILHHVYTCLHTMFCTCYKLFVLSLPCRMLCTQVKMETTWPSAEMSASYRSTY